MAIAEAELDDLLSRPIDEGELDALLGGDAPAARPAPVDGPQPEWDYGDTRGASTLGRTNAVPYDPARDVVSEFGKMTADEMLNPGGETGGITRAANAFTRSVGHQAISVAELLASGGPEPLTGEQADRDVAASQTRREMANTARATVDDLYKSRKSGEMDFADYLMEASGALPAMAGPTGVVSKAVGGGGIGLMAGLAAQGGLEGGAQSALHQGELGAGLAVLEKLPIPRSAKTLLEIGGMFAATYLQTGDLNQSLVNGLFPLVGGKSKWVEPRNQLASKLAKADNPAEVSDAVGEAILEMSAYDLSTRNPLAAEKIIENPSRKTFKEAGLPTVNAKERTAFADVLKRVIDETDVAAETGPDLTANAAEQTTPVTRTEPPAASAVEPQSLTPTKEPTNGQGQKETQGRPEGLLTEKGATPSAWEEYQSELQRRGLSDPPPDGPAKRALYSEANRDPAFAELQDRAHAEGAPRKQGWYSGAKDELDRALAESEARNAAEGDGSPTARRDVQEQATATPESRTPPVEAGVEAKATEPTVPVEAKAETPPLNPMQDPRYYSLRQEFTRAERQRMGLSDIDSPSRRTTAESIRMAIEQKVPEKALDIATEVIAKGRVPTSIENDGLNVRQVQIARDIKKLMEADLDIADPALKHENRVQRDRLQDDYDLLTRATDVAGSEQGRALESRKHTLDEDMNVVQIKSDARLAKGEKLTPQEAEAFDRVSAELQEVKAKLEQIELNNKIEHADAVLKESRRTRRRESPVAKDTELTDLYKRASDLLRNGCLDV